MPGARILTLPVQTDPLDYYARIGAALFPLPAGSKMPGPASFWPSPSDPNKAASFKTDASRDPAQWAAWRAQHPGCNMGVVAFASRLIIVDIDTKDGRDAAWAAWCEVCKSWGLDAPLMPHTQSARGGWHVLCSIPEGVDPATLRQPDAVKDIINLRCVGYTVAAGSYYDGTAKGEASGPYSLMSDAAPHPAPAALIEYCTRRANPVPKSGVTLPGSRDKNDVAGLLAWLNERGGFHSYEDWLHVGMALKMEYGDDGFASWELTFDETVTPGVAASKWESFSTEPTADSVTLNTFLDRAHKMGWRGSVRKSAAAMFDGVAALAAASGASRAATQSGLPTPPRTSGAPLPMLVGQEELARLGTPILEAFLQDTSDAPAFPGGDLPMLPSEMMGHGLYDLMQESIRRVFALTELKPWKAGRINDAMAVLHQVNLDVFESICRKLQNSGFKLEIRRIKNTSASIQDGVERVTVTHDKWEYDDKGKPEADNPDNVIVFLEIIGCEIRWNAWLEQMEIRGGTDPDYRWPNWAYVDDVVVAKLLTRARRTKTRFRPGKDFMWETLIALARQNTVDPVLDAMAAIKWDGVERLSSWLVRLVGTPDDRYHREVGKVILCGMVMRAHAPGAKFDLMPVFYGPQGTGKSSMAAILSMKKEWFTDNVMFGDASKELILSLAGKLVAEIGEMGARSHANVQLIKAMVTREVDEGRTAYARAVTKRPRRNIFIGTTNETQPLNDPSGNRRFMPVKVEREIDLAGLRAELDQLIAEAVHLWNVNGEAIGNLPREAWGEAETYQEGARQASDLEEYALDWFGEQSGCYVTKADLLRLANATGYRNAGAAMSVIMGKFGFRDSSPRIGGARTRVWYRASTEMLPANVAKLPRWHVDEQSCRVVLRGGDQGRQSWTALPAPPLPDRGVPPCPVGPC